MLSAIWAERKRELAIDFTISIRRSPHGPCQLELYSSFRPKCQNNVNLIMLIHWQGVCVYPADVWGLIRTSLVQFTFSALVRVLFFFRGWKWYQIGARGEKRAKMENLPSNLLSQEQNNLLNVKQPASEASKWSLWRRALVANQKQALICTRYILRQVSLASEAIGLIY